MTASSVVLLGPQGTVPRVRDALRDLGVREPVAIVTAGWEERERELLPFMKHVELPVRNLDVFRRAEVVYGRDPDLHAAMRKRHDRVRAQQRLYRARLAHALDAARESLARSDAPPGLLAADRRDAIDAIRRLDAFHLARVDEIELEFELGVRPAERPAVALHRARIRERLAGCRALCIAGGHVGILVNRMRLLGVLDAHLSLPGDRPIVAWSAGAMALASRVVLFHDHPPQGAGNAEVFRAGLGIAPGIVPLPHADRRLALADRARVALFAARFAPDACVVLNAGARLDLRAGDWHATPDTLRLAPDGSLGPVQEVA
ncbi:MAG: hypothetical protein IPM29_14195 [Planctomycetes bacterium]|nr:hypothetical protein [Planctomycetota bacterium]